ncbi:hypothetical protein THAOC_32418 [Thalassiosira oceanica]|uniref:Uncharacterized protein n=1 Tax=Thalassiosira oceanica TaxID=159749 RepID=K0RIP9_THAOC|nr:hypothetical protein THAOC_32418 [Thalassiosira oceanica]|eukprot:EJK48756.1 hypothetical protein THAOC_32418 [Thalassiosira oceanica]
MPGFAPWPFSESPSPGESENAQGAKPGNDPDLISSIELGSDVIARSSRVESIITLPACSLNTFRPRNINRSADQHGTGWQGITRRRPPIARASTAPPRPTLSPRPASDDESLAQHGSPPSARSAVASSDGVSGSSRPPRRKRKLRRPDFKAGMPGRGGLGEVQDWSPQGQLPRKICDETGPKVCQLVPFFRVVQIKLQGILS